MKPFLMMNAGSGGGHARDVIVSTAKELGIDHHVVEPGDNFDAVLEQAVSRGADLLITAGGDGTLSAAANVALKHDLPLVVVPAGTRNHFALDVGLDLTDPAGVLRTSLTSGYERRVDVGMVNGITFLNGASLGLYAAAVATPGYRDHKVAAFVGAARGAVSREEGRQAHLSVSVPGSSLNDVGIDSAAVLIVNNAYAAPFAPAARLRPRLDAGEVWVYVGAGPGRGKGPVATLGDTIEAAITKQHLRAAFGVDGVVITSDRPDVPIAVDGEFRPDLTAPFEFASRARALRLVVPTDPSPRPVEVLLSW